MKKTLMKKFQGTKLSLEFVCFFIADVSNEKKHYS